MEPLSKVLFTRKEAAEMLSISVSTLDVAIARGMLRARRIGNRVRVHRTEIERFARTDHPDVWSKDENGKTSRLPHRGELEERPGPARADGSNPSPRSRLAEA